MTLDMVREVNEWLIDARLQMVAHLATGVCSHAGVDSRGDGKSHVKGHLDEEERSSKELWARHGICQRL